MINYNNIKERVDKYNSLLLKKVEATKDLTPFQLLFTKGKITQAKYKDMSYLEIYKSEYKRVDKITEEHIKRGVLDIESIFKKLNLEEDYISLAKTTHELHDIARRIQYIKTGTVVDADSYDKELIKKRGLNINHPPEVINHATHGAYLLDNGLFNFLDVQDEYRTLISTAVKNHSNNKLSTELKERVPDSLFDGKSLENVLKEQKLYQDLIRLYVQTVKSVDNFDLNNKVLLGAIPLIRSSFGLDVFEGDKIEDFVRLWGVKEKTLRDYNKLTATQNIEEGQIIYIPTSEVPIEKFTIPDYYMDMLINDTFPERLKELQIRKDYNFLIAQIFRLSLLRNIEFKSLLQLVSDNNMLDEMLNLYPEQFKEIMKPAFDYAKEHIVKKGLEDKESKIYTLRRKCHE